MRLGLSILLPLVLTAIVIGVVQRNSIFKSGNVASRPVSVGSDWKFYYGKMLDPDQLKEKKYSSVTVTLPYSWTSETRSPVGYGTFRKKIIVPRDVGYSSIHFPAIHSASRIFLNGVLVDSSGSVGIFSEYQGKIRSSTISLPYSADTLDIVVQVANYTTLTGGISKVPYIQNTTSFFRIQNIRYGIQNCFIGILLAMFLYQVILFIFHSEDASYLVLAIICLLVAIRSLLITGASQLLSEFFSGLDSSFWFKLGFITVYITLWLLPLYFRLLFPMATTRWPLKIFRIIALMLCILTVATPHYVYGRLLDVYHFGMLLVFAYSVYTIFRALRLGNEEARLMLWGVLMAFPFILLEMLQNSRAIQLGTGVPFLTEMGLLTFLQFQVLLLSNRYAISFRALKAMNQNLEYIVAQRTDQLSTANRIKDRLLSIISHDIKSPLNSLRSIISLFNKKKMTNVEFQNMMDLLEVELEKTSMLVENILSWSADQLKGVTVKKESFDLLKLLELNIQLFHSALEKKHITVCHDLVNGFPIVSDQRILNTVVRNLLSNAIKFTRPSGKISIRVSKNESRLKLEIEDTGIGMNEQTLQSLMDPRHAVINPGTSNEHGTGLGILLCRELISKLNGELLIESKVNIGSRFVISIPVVANL